MTRNGASVILGKTTMRTQFTAVVVGRKPRAPELGERVERS